MPLPARAGSEELRLGARPSRSGPAPGPAPQDDRSSPIIFGGFILARHRAAGVAGFFTNYLWFHWNGVGDVWSTVTSTKIVITAIFIVVAFAVVFASLLLVDRVVARTLFMGPDTDLVRRYQAIVGPHALALRITVSGLVALALGSGTSSQWQHWLLFEHNVAFGKLDPVFSRDISFWIFRLPFLSFLVDWMFEALIVVFIVTAIAYFVNGALRLQGSIHVEPRAIAHLSFILSLIAIERAWAFYFVDRFGLELSHHGVVEGMSYTDLHVRVPAIEFLAVVSIVSFAMLAFNVYQRTLVLLRGGGRASGRSSGDRDRGDLPRPLPGAAGDSFAEHPRTHLDPTRHHRDDGGDGDRERRRRRVPGDSGPHPERPRPVQADTLNDVQLWDPVFSKPTFTKLQAQFSGYNLTNLGIDRYQVNGKTTPVVIGARALNSGGLPTQSWANTHLIYTQGYAGR